MCDPTTPRPLDTAFAIAETGTPPVARPGGESLRVGPADAIAEGSVQIVPHGSSSIGVFRRQGAYYAIRNVCPHQGAPLCLGHLHSTYRPAPVSEYEPTLEGRVVRCPWHGWEFDLVTGKGLYDLRSRVKTYATRVDAEGTLWIDL